MSSNVEAANGYSLQQGIFLENGRIVIVAHSNIMGRVLQYIHVNPLAGYSRYLKTYQRAKHDFYWKGMKGNIKKLVREFDVCQAIKYETCAPSGLLQPLPIPQQSWVDISIDFIESLPKSKGYNVILVVVDRFTKYSHFIPLTHPFIASRVVELFMQNVFKLHGLPRSIVSDKDLIFLSSFWKSFFALQGSTLNFSLAY